MRFGRLSQRFEEVPLLWPERSGMGIQMLRSRIIVEAQDNQARRFQAELAPYPGVHAETLEEARVRWELEVQPVLLEASINLDTWDWQKPWFGLLPLPRSDFSSIQSAGEELLLNLASCARPEAFTLAKPLLLQGSALLRVPRKAHQDKAWQEFMSLWTEGFRVFKCKVGHLAVEEELNFLRQMQAFAGPDLSLRLDGNQRLNADDRTAWRELATDLPIDYWEEAGDTWPASGHRQALDESLWDRTPGDAPSPAGVWVLKPSRLGLSRTVAWLEAATAEGRLAVLSNCFDSGLSLGCFAWIYARFCSDPQPLGFGTQRFLPDDAWGSRDWGRPWIHAPSRPFPVGQGAV